MVYPSDVIVVTWNESVAVVIEGLIMPKNVTFRIWPAYREAYVAPCIVRILLLSLTVQEGLELIALEMQSY